MGNGWLFTGFSWAICEHSEYSWDRDMYNLSGAEELGVGQKCNVLSVGENAPPVLGSQLEQFASQWRLMGSQTEF